MIIYKNIGDRHTSGPDQKRYFGFKVYPYTLSDLDNHLFGFFANTSGFFLKLKFPPSHY